MPKDMHLNWDFSCPPWAFVGLVLAASLGTRILLSGLRAVMLTYDIYDKLSGLQFKRSFRCSFTGFFPKGFFPGETEHKRSEYGFVFLLGTLELLVYPILIASGAWLVIGAWISLKSLAQWNVWTTHRAIFNLFLIGNALNVILSSYIAHVCIKLV